MVQHDQGEPETPVTEYMVDVESLPEAQPSDPRWRDPDVRRFVLSWCVPWKEIIDECVEKIRAEKRSPRVIVGIPLVDESWFLPSLESTLERLDFERSEVGILFGLSANPDPLFAWRLPGLLTTLHGRGYAFARAFYSHYDNRNVDALNNPSEGKIADIAIKREYIRKIALRVGCPHVMWLDADMIVPGMTLTSFLSHTHEADIVAGAYRCRSGDPQGVPVPAVFINNLEERQRDDRFLVGLPKGMSVPIPEVLSGQPFYADAVGFGCVLTSRRALESANFLSLVGPVGEDVAFCVMARRAGLKILIDTSIRLGHLQRDGTIL